MKRIGITAIVAASVLAGPLARAQPSAPAMKAGEQHEISMRYENAQEGSDGSSGSSSGGDAILETVIAVTESGTELEYDLRPGATPEDRARDWFFPARILRQPDGSMRLLNRAELEARLERWLTAAEWSREVCGRWIFTWNAFRIECDPEAVIDTIKAFDLLSADLREGAPYRDSDASEPGLLRRTNGLDGTRFIVSMDVDPDAVRRERAEADVTVGEIMQRPMALDTAMSRRALERISGTIEVTFDVDPDRKPRRRTRITRLEIIEPDGVRHTETRVMMVERRPASSAASRQ